MAESSTIRIRIPSFAFCVDLGKLPVGWVGFISALAEINRNPTMHSAMLGYAIANPTYESRMMLAVTAKINRS
jgi:hypothetical protein